MVTTTSRPSVMSQPSERAIRARARPADNASTWAIPSPPSSSTKHRAITTATVATRRRRFCRPRSAAPKPTSWAAPARNSVRARAGPRPTRARRARTRRRRASSSAGHISPNWSRDPTPARHHPTGTTIRPEHDRRRGWTAIPRGSPSFRRARCRGFGHSTSSRRNPSSVAPGSARIGPCIARWIALASTPEPFSCR